MKNSYIKQLPYAIQTIIRNQLIENGITGDDLETALDSHISDLKDIIDVDKVLSLN